MIDASVAIKWVVAEPFSDQAASLLAGTVMIAPAHWQAEAVNGLWGWVHRGGLSAEDAGERVSRLIDAPVASVPLANLMDRALALAIALRVTVYDALYIALAEARGTPFVTADPKLLRRMLAEPTLAALAQSLIDLPPP